MPVLTIQQIIDGFEGNIPERFTSTLGKLEPTEEIIRKLVPDRLIRFEEGEPAMIGVVSDLRKDRDREVVFPEGMDDSNESGVVSWNHDYWREAIPHARTLWNKLDPKGNPYQVLSKTLYLVELSPLGKSVYEYRKALHPLGQSIGFKSVESVWKGDSGYNDVFKAWLPRVKAMLKEKKIKPTPDEFTEPIRIITKWEKWEHGDVFIGSNPDALQVAVSKSILTPAEAKQLVDFEREEKPEEEERFAILEKQLTALNVDVENIKSIVKIIQDDENNPPLTIEEMWNNSEEPPTLAEMWKGNEM